VGSRPGTPEAPPAPDPPRRGPLRVPRRGPLDPAALAARLADGPVEVVLTGPAPADDVARGAEVGVVATALALGATVAGVAPRTLARVAAVQGALDGASGDGPSGDGAGGGR